MNKKYIYLGIGILILAFLVFTIPKFLTGNVVKSSNSILVITMTHCPECREMLKPYLDKIKEEYGAEIREYQVSSPFDPAVDKILSENELKRPVGGGMPIVCINENCFLRMDPIKVELDKFMEQ